MKNYYEALGISEIVYEFGERTWEKLLPRFAELDRISEANQLKVLAAFQEEQVSEACLLGTTGYGYNDIGRDTLERVYARIFKTEDALVRPQIVCGTHAIALGLFSNLRPGDELLCPAGKPYDTMDEVIGIRPSTGSLAEYGVTYRQVDLKEDGSFDFEGIKAAIGPKTKMALIQRSRGYASRKTFSPEMIGELIAFLKKEKPELICMVDNCYGEFVCLQEPTEFGADLMAGSLIKNPGGGLAPIGGYLVGKKECIDNAAARLTSPGLGREVGASLQVLPALYQGLFLAPQTTCCAVKGSIFAACLYEQLGFTVLPDGQEPRYDIIQEVIFENPENLVAFCEGIQYASPVDSHVRPEPWEMPGYDDDVIMAAGTFVSGASIELSADGPLRAPYAAYFQGGITWQHAKFGILRSVQELYNKGRVTL